MRTTLLRTRWVLLLGAAAVLSLSAGDALAGHPHHSSGTGRTVYVTPYGSYSQASVAQPLLPCRTAVVPQPLPWRGSAVTIERSRGRHYSTDQCGSSRELRFHSRPARCLGWGRTVSTVGYSTGGFSIQIVIR